MGTRQAYRPEDERLGIVEFVAAVGYLIALVIIAGTLIFGFPFLLWLWLA